VAPIDADWRSEGLTPDYPRIPAEIILQQNLQTDEKSGILDKKRKATGAMVAEL